MMPACDVCSRFFAEEFLIALGPAVRTGSTVYVLDVGIGSARIPIDICRRRPDVEIIGVDRRRTILQKARRDIHLAGLAGAVYVQQADACSLPFPDASFDAVISNSLVHHLPRPRDTLSEMIRVLCPGGLLCVRDSLPQPDAALIAGTLRESAEKRRYRLMGGRVACPLTLGDARQLAAAAGMPATWVRQSGSRHWLLCGRFAGGSGALHARDYVRTV
jgi:ubiquinone/menaquinone biosynthesis C-methylase UbiE